MRFDHVIKFYDKSERHYDPKTHGYVGGEKLVSTLHGNVTDVGTVKSVQLFGDYKQNSLVIRLYAAPPKWSYLTIDDGVQKYVLQTTRKPLKLFTLIVGESNG
nr:MAG TPA: head closure knob [Caudoviricetes sp.]